jgi:hypothetical protein
MDIADNAVNESQQNVISQDEKINILENVSIFC